MKPVWVDDVVDTLQLCDTGSEGRRRWGNYSLCLVVSHLLNGLLSLFTLVTLGLLMFEFIHACNTWLVDV